MPLEKSKSQSAFVKNIKDLVTSGKSKKPAVKVKRGDK